MGGSIPAQDADGIVDVAGKDRIPVLQKLIELNQDPGGQLDFPFPALEKKIVPSYGYR